MKIQTFYFGEIEMDEKSVVQFPNGIPGFHEEKEFVLLDIPDNPAFQILQSVHNQQLAFVVTNPYLFYKDYEFELDESTIEQLNIGEPEDVAVYTIVTLHDPFEQSTINLQAPIVMNTKNNMAKQVVLNNTSYQTKHLISKKNSSQGEPAHASTDKKNQ
ncbi:MAG: flagellar assembly protein FliW [Bacillaceae bacterium]|nr:flagellar assembly protein FliW [Bacillaceae bacterium]